MIDRKQAMISAIRLFQSRMPNAAVREVNASLILKRWYVKFVKLLPEGEIEVPGNWCVIVNAATGEAEWLETL